MLEPIPFAGMVEIDESFDRTASHMAGEYVSYNEPVAWAMFKDNTFMDAIHPDEHTRFEGGYTIPLYTHPAKTLTNREIDNLIADVVEKPTDEDLYDFAIAILKKAQDR
jgi:hypothetical protein